MEIGHDCPGPVAIVESDKIATLQKNIITCKREFSRSRLCLGHENNATTATKDSDSILRTSRPVNYKERKPSPLVSSPNHTPHAASLHRWGSPTESR